MIYLLLHYYCKLVCMHVVLITSASYLLYGILLQGIIWSIKIALSLLQYICEVKCLVSRIPASYLDYRYAYIKGSLKASTCFLCSYISLTIYLCRSSRSISEYMFFLMPVPIR